MFISPQVIYADLARTYKNTTFNYSDIVEWCMQVETEYIGDVDIMWKYRFIVKIKNGRISLPNNVYRILSITTERGLDIDYPAVSSLYVHGLSPYEGELMVVTFLGVPVDDECMPLIAASHRIPCQQFCIINIIKPEALIDLNKFRQLQVLEEQFNSAVTSAKQGFREWTEQDIKRLSLHSYNKVFKEVYKKYYQYNIFGNTYFDINEMPKQRREIIIDESVDSDKTMSILNKMMSERE